MKDVIKIEAGKSLPSVEELLNVLRLHETVTFSYNTLAEGYVSQLTYSLPSYAVFNRGWDKTIIISPSITNEKILQKRLELFECAKAFRSDANQLMHLMSNTFGIDLQTLDGLHELKYKKSDKQRGLLNDEWSYHLHGAECRFESNKTKQVVEIIIITKPEFGYLDCYFFYNYIATTERFKPLAAYFDNNHLHICKAIDLLVLEGILTRVTDLFINRNVIAI